MQRLIAPPPTTDPKANRQALQALLDKTLFDGTKPVEPALIEFPIGEWPIDRPLQIDARKATIRGAGPQLSRILPQGAHDGLVCGIHPRPYDPVTRAPLALDPAHLPDAFGVLDRRAAPAPGARRGFRTLGRCNLCQAGGGLDLAGPKDHAYASVSMLLVEACLDVSRMQGQAASIAGMRDDGPRPWSLVWWGGDPSRPNLVVSWRTRAFGDPGEGIARDAFAPIPPNLGPILRLTVILDLAAGQLGVYFNDQRAPLVNISGPKMAPGETLASNDWCHFGIGGVGGGAMQGHDYIGGDGDIGVFGFRVGNASPYDPGAATLTRKDGGPVGDDFRYFRAGPDLIALVPGTDPPAEVIAERRLTILSGGNFGASATDAYVLDRFAHPNPFGGVMDLAIENLGIECADWRYGDAVKIEAAGILRIEKGQYTGGARGIAGLSWGPVYPFTGRDLQLSGTECSLHLAGVCSSRFSDLRFDFDRAEQRAMVRAVRSGVEIAGAFAPQWGCPQYGFFGRWASAYLRHWAMDNEGSGGSQIADAYCWPVGDKQPTSQLVVEDFQTAMHGPNASGIILAGPGPKDGERSLIGDASLRVNAFGIHPHAKPRSMVRVLEEAAGIWRDDGVNLGRTRNIDGTSRVLFEGPPLLPTVAPAPIPTPTPATA